MCDAGLFGNVLRPATNGAISLRHSGLRGIVTVTFAVRILCVFWVWRFGFALMVLRLSASLPVNAEYVPQEPSDEINERIAKPSQEGVRNELKYFHPGDGALSAPLSQGLTLARSMAGAFSRRGPSESLSPSGYLAHTIPNEAAHKNNHIIREAIRRGV